MRIERNRYAYTRGRFRLLRAVIVSDDGLVLEYALGLRSTTPWTKVCGVRYARTGQAEVEFVGGRRLRLPGSGARLEQLIKTLSEECVESQEEWRRPGVSEALIGEWLGVGSGTIEHDANVKARIVGPLLAVVCGLMAYQDAAPDAWKLWLAAGICAVGGIGGFLNLWGVTAVSRHAISHEGMGKRWTVTWAEVLGTSHWYRGKRNTGISIWLVTANGRRNFTGPRDLFQCVADTAERVAEANSARFVGPGDNKVPETALSPARLTSGGAERGLSRSSDA